MCNEKELTDEDKNNEPIHVFFELSYAQYLALPRSVLQSMPVEWQRKFVALLEELDDTIDWRPKEGQLYRVQLMKVNQDRRGDDEFWEDDLEDPLQDYERGRRQIPHREKK